MNDDKNPEDILGDNGIFKAFKKALLERVLSAELTDHLGCEAHDSKGRKAGNSRNRYGKKRITGEDGEMSITVPRDRDASFEPRIIKKGQRPLEGGVLKTDCFRLVEARGKAFPHMKLFQKRRVHRLN